MVDLDLKFSSQMLMLRENVLIKKFVLYFLIPATTLCIIGIFTEYVYVILAMTDSDSCLCSIKNP